MRFIIYILAPLLPASKSLMVVAVTCLVASEVAKMFMLHTRSHLLTDTTGHKNPNYGHTKSTIGRVPATAGRLMPLLSPIIPLFLHHYQFLIESHLDHLVRHRYGQDQDHVICNKAKKFTHKPQTDGPTTRQELALTSARLQLRSAEALRGELRATENVLEHFIQVSLSLVVLLSTQQNLAGRAHG